MRNSFNSIVDQLAPPIRYAPMKNKYFQFYSRLAFPLRQFFFGESQLSILQQISIIKPCQRFTINKEYLSILQQISLKAFVENETTLIKAFFQFYSRLARERQFNIHAHLRLSLSILQQISKYKRLSFNQYPKSSSFNSIVDQLVLELMVLSQ